MLRTGAFYLPVYFQVLGSSATGAGVRYVSVFLAIATADLGPVMYGRVWVCLDFSSRRGVLTIGRAAGCSRSRSPPRLCQLSRDKWLRKPGGGGP